MSYDLRRLRLHRLIERLPNTQRYRLTPFGLKTALFYSRTYQRLLRRGLSELHDPPTAQSSTLALALQFSCWVENAVHENCSARICPIQKNFRRLRCRKTGRLKT